MNNYFIYILSSKTKILYIGTDNLARRTYEHKEGLVERFSKKYNMNELVYWKFIQI
jgi:putative endonuclease